MMQHPSYSDKLQTHTEFLSLSKMASKMYKDPEKDLLGILDVGQPAEEGPSAHKRTI